MCLGHVNSWFITGGVQKISEKKAFFQQSAVINSLNILHENLNFQGKNFLHYERNDSNEH